MPLRPRPVPQIIASGCRCRSQAVHPWGKEHSGAEHSKRICQRLRGFASRFVSLMLGRDPLVILLRGLSLLVLVSMAALGSSLPLLVACLRGVPLALPLWPSPGPAAPVASFPRGFQSEFLSSCLPIHAGAVIRGDVQ
uniref:Uncharacterized protein n=1 Tax=Knipowitschia caucasica TaxID=637954 RepID=A0AAV2LGT0_KNICA